MNTFKQILFFLFIINNVYSQVFNLRRWDLIFQEAGNDTFSIAIKKVTPSFKGHSFNHVGIIIDSTNTWYVLEAISKGVVLTPFEEFIKRTSIDSIFIGKINVAFQEPDLKFISNILGKKYDYYFDLYNDLYYCSEIVYLLYKTPEGKPLFELMPMTFVDTTTGKVFQIWENYFKSLNIEIPEGEPGINPGSIANSPCISIYKLSELIKR